MPDLEAYALQRLKFQLHSWSISELSNGFQEICAFPNKEARQLVITEAIRSYSKVPQLAQALHKAAREVGDLAIDLVEAWGNVHRQPED